MHPSYLVGSLGSFSSPIRAALELRFPTAGENRCCKILVDVHIFLNRRLNAVSTILRLIQMSAFGNVRGKKSAAELNLNRGHEGAVRTSPEFN